MFSQFLGFGIKEKPIINWLGDEGWKISGYTVKKSRLKDNQCYYEFSREPLNRFKDFNNETLEPTKLIYNSNYPDILKNIKNIIDDIKNEFPNVSPEDIGIVFISKNNLGYQLANMISVMIEQNYNWETQKIYESKYKYRDQQKIFISNQNNVKGLEFSFLIGIALDKITDNIDIRNTLYMMMTRSFLTSYLLLDNTNKEIYDIYNPLLQEILDTQKVSIKKPKSEDILKEEELKKLISGSLTFEQKIERALKNKNLDVLINIDKVKNLVKLLKNGDNSVKVADIEEIISNNRGYFE